MSEQIGTLALKATLDGNELTQGFAKAEQGMASFVSNMKAHAQRLVAELRAGNIEGALRETTAGLTALAEQGIRSLGPLGVAALGVSAAVTGIGAAARSVTREMKELSNLSGRLGASTTDTQILVRALQRGGVDDAESVLQKFFERLGSARQDFGGPQAQALERLGLNPARITSASPLAAFRETLGALSRVENQYDRAAIAQDLFGKSFDQLTELMRQGDRAWERAEEAVRSFGDTQQMVARSLVAEERWRRTAETAEFTWGAIRRFGREAAVSISNDLAAIASAFPDIIGGRAPTTNPAERARRAREQLDAVRGLSPLAPPTDRLFETIQQSTPDAIAARARTWEQMLRGPLAVIQEMNREAAAARFGQAVDLWVTRAAIGLDGLRESLRTTIESVNSASALAAQWQRTAEAMGLSAAEVRQVAIAEQEAEARRLGIFGFLQGQRAAELRHADGLLTRAEQLNRLREEGARIADSVRTPGDRFLDEVRAIRANHTISEAIRQEAMGARLRGFVQSLGGPASFALSGTSSRSLEGYRSEQDFRVRSEVGRPDQMIQAAQQQVREQQGMRADLRALGQRLEEAIRDGAIGGF